MLHEQYTGFDQLVSCTNLSLIRRADIPNHRVDELYTIYTKTWLSLIFFTKAFAIFKDLKMVISEATLLSSKKLNIL